MRFMDGEVSRAPARTARRRPRSTPRREQERQENGGRPHVLDALDYQVVVAGDAVAQLFERGVEQFDDQDEDQRRRSARTRLPVSRGEVEGERNSDRQHHQLLAERLFRVAPPQRGRASY